eukprot:362312-Chlamydomonas_euryale.AAC.2
MNPFGHTFHVRQGLREAEAGWTRREGEAEGQGSGRTRARAGGKKQVCCRAQVWAHLRRRHCRQRPPRGRRRRHHPPHHRPHRRRRRRRRHERAPRFGSYFRGRRPPHQLARSPRGVARPGRARRASAQQEALAAAPPAAHPGGACVLKSGPHT